MADIITDDVLVPPVEPTVDTIPLTPDVPLDVELDTVTPIEMTGEPTVTNLDKIGEFFGTMQESVTIAWRYHLKTKKHYIHIALQEYYWNALRYVDNIIEQYMGTTGNIIENYTNMVTDSGKDEATYLQELKGYISSNKDLFGFESEIMSSIDNLLGDLDNTIYKVTSFCENSIKSFDEFVYEDYEVIGVEGGVDGVFDTTTKTTKTNNATSKETMGVEGGEDGVFDNITKTTKNNVAPVGTTKDKKESCSDCEDCEEEEE